MSLFDIYFDINLRSCSEGKQWLSSKIKMTIIVEVSLYTTIPHNVVLTFIKMLLRRIKKKHNGFTNLNETRLYIRCHPPSPKIKLSVAHRNAHKRAWNGILKPGFPAYLL